MTRLTHRFTRSSLALLAALTLAACSQYATVKEREPKFPTTSTAPAVCQECIASGMRLEDHKPLEALGAYLEGAQAAAERLRSSPKDHDALAAYNFAVARAFSAIKEGHLDPWTKPMQVPSKQGGYVLTNKPDRRKAWAPQLYNFTPADRFDVGGLYVTERTTKPGLGAPLVAIGKKERENAREIFISKHTFYGITAVARFEPGRKCVISFEDPLEKENTTFDGRSYPLAADFTVPMAVMLAQENPKKLELSRLLRPGKYAETAHIVRLEPYRPDKIPVVVVHGLADSPATWTRMINNLRGDPLIRQKYQFWYYSYPSGYPYPYSASIMRQELDAIEKKFNVHQKIVLVGHSMGSMVSRLMVTDVGDKIWLKFFGKPPGEMNLAPDTRNMLEGSLIFNSRPEVGRVIFLAGPHRGADLAGNWVGRLGAKLVKAPLSLLKVASDVRHVLQADPSALKVTHIPNSVDTLAPSNRFVKAINTFPINPRIPFHSVMGDRGRGDTPNSSDGLVPYWSSHLEGARSELIVPSNHSVQQNPEAIAEVRRILHLHVGAKSEKE